MAIRGNSPRKTGTIIDAAHIAIGLIVIIMAVFAIFRPDRYSFLFPLIFLASSVLSLFNAWYLFTAYQRNLKRRVSAAVYALLGLVLLCLFAVSAVSIWLRG